MSWDHLDESDVRVRPNPRGSRRRTKTRPAHEDAVLGFVTGVDRGRYAVLLAAGVGGKKTRERVITAMRARELGRKSVVVGDDVALVGDTAGGPDALARIVRVEPRRSVLRRSADDTDTVERVIVANADQLVVVSALADPEPRPRLIDRCLVAAYDAGLDPLLVLTKADLVAADAFLAAYAPLAVPYVVTRRDPSDPDEIDGIEEVRAHLAGRVSVLIGHSGVGKSTLVNRLVPDAERAVGVVNAVTGRGRHTSTSTVALRLPAAEGSAEGWVIDTAGIRSFGLAHVEPARIITFFPDLEPGTAECPRGCTHDEEECALDAYVATGAAGPAGASRLDSLRRLLRARLGTDDRTDDRTDERANQGSDERPSD
jgi:ribosome biogenesis GTPase / thiamine phosphate phosphatase